MAVRPPPLLRALLFVTGGGALAALLGTASRAPAAVGDDEGRLLDGRLHHLGDSKTPGWKEADETPEGTALAIEFEGHANAGEWLLEFAQRDVDDGWSVALNGKVLGALRRSPDELRSVRLAIPPSTVLEGKNTLTVSGTNPRDDILIGRFRLHERSLREVYSLGRLVVRVRDVANGQPLPARVTVVDAAGGLVELFYAEARTTAVRHGIVYTADGVAALEAPAGALTVFATRGVEWSLASAPVNVTKGGAAELDLALTREVDTTGWIAADTHIHTFTFSGHGDATVEERLATIAGEGIELPVATDHNHHTDYAPLQKAMALGPWFTPVVGNEVTTDNGHMNAFPFAADVPVPESKKSDWADLVAGIRERGAQFIILNHPRWPEKGRDPLTKFGFDDKTGGNAAGQRFLFDGYELVNSDSPVSPPQMVLPGWYALLNRGLRFTGVGASDSHAVGVIVGQGRTYVPSATDDPARIDVAAAVRAFKEGRVSVSHGLIADVSVRGAGAAPARMGDVLRPEQGAVEATVTIRHPSWVKPRRLDLVVDGVVVANADLAPAPGDGATSCVRRVRVPVPAHDGWLVAVAWGDPVTLPCWRTELADTVAITNPVFLDGDGDGHAGSPRAVAQAVIGRCGSDAAALALELPRLDDGAAFQLLDLVHEALGTAAAGPLATLAAGRPALAAWVAATFPPGDGAR